MTSKEYIGLAASPGIAVGTAWVFQKAELLIERYRVENIDAELDRLATAIDQARIELQALEKRAREHIGEEEAAIFEAHQLFLEDPDMIGDMENLVRGQNINAEAAVHDVAEQYIHEFEQAESEYFRARALDLHDVTDRIIRCLQGAEHMDTRIPGHPVIVVADDLTPSDTVQLDKTLILGLVTAKGGPTSHTAILARSLGIPAVVSVPINVAGVEPRTTVIIDGLKGLVIVDPDEEEQEEARTRRVQWQEQESAHLARAHEPAITLDGHRVEVVANVGQVEDVRDALRYGAEGVGLFRTEFLYLDRTTMPDEEEQYRIYKEVFEVLNGAPAVVRTFDIGGDKSVPYIGNDNELNPFLGWRGIRMIDRHPNMLATQLRALLRAGVGGDLRIMLPMVSNIDEIRLARSIYEEARAQLIKSGVPVAERVQFGIMIEVPSAALMADRLAPELDFFSIGTNDLTQYTLAVDRVNSRVSHLADTFHPSVLTLIHQTIEAAHAHGKWVGLCGEFAGRPLAIPILLGLGLDEFSMAGTAIPAIKACIRNLNREKCRPLALEVLRLSTPAEVRATCEAFMAPIMA